MTEVMRKTLFFFVVLTAMVFLGASLNVLAQRPYRVTDNQVANSLRQLESESDLFVRGLQAGLDRSNLNGTQYEDEVISYVRDFEEATDRLKERFDGRASVANDVQEVLGRASNIDRFLNQNRLTPRVNTDWNQVRADLSTLANYYNVSWNWNNYPVYQTGGVNRNTAANRLTGTYRLNAAQSSNVEAEIDRVLNDVDFNRRERIRRNATRRLTAPEELALERTGRTVTIASSNSPRITLEATGRAQTETMPNGRSMSITATLIGEQLVLDYTGDRVNDFYVAFNPIGNGDTLRVTRRIYLEGINRQVTADSVYTRVSNVARFDDVYRGGFNNNRGVNTNNNTNTNNAQSDQFAVPNGTRLVAVLNQDLNTRTSQQGDRFSMEVRSPNEYNGATIEGRVARVERSGRVSGRAEIGLDFETIRLRDGRTYRFSGLVDSLRPTNNDNVTVNNEGAVREGNSQTNRTVTRTAVGAALGALIGAIAGGGEGAAIGAAAAAVVADIFGGIDLGEVLGGAGIGAIAGLLLRGRNEVEVVVVNPDTDLDLTLQSDLRLN